MPLPESNPNPNHERETSLGSSYAAIQSMDVNVKKGRLLREMILGDMTLEQKALLARTIMDIEKNKRRTLLYSFHYSKGEVMSPTFPFEIPADADWFPSPSCTKLCVIRHDDNEGKPGPADVQSDLCSRIEIWSFRDGTLLSCLPTASAHGKIITDNTFGGVEWHPDETTLLYVAKIKDQPGKSFFDYAKKNGDMISQGGEEGDLNLYHDDWGENYTDIHDLGLFMVGLATGKVIKVPIGKGITPASPVFIRSGDAVLYEAYEPKPVRSGINFRFNTPRKLYAIRVTSLIELLHTEDESISSAETIKEGPCCLTPDDHVSLCPRISPCGLKLVWLSRSERFDTHNGPFRICTAVLSENESGQPGETQSSFKLCDRSILADICESEPLKDTAWRYTGVWPSLTLPVLAQHCWAPDSSAVFLSTLNRCKQSLFKVDASGKGVTPVQLDYQSVFKVDKEALLIRCQYIPVKELTPAQLEEERDEQERYSFTLLDVGYNGLLVSFSSPNSPPSFVIVPFDGNNKKGYVRLPEFGPCAIARPAILGASSNLYVSREAVRGIRWRIMHVRHSDHPGGQSFECILLLPCDKSQSVPPSGFPLMVMVHGGPHSAYTTLFQSNAAFFCATQRNAILMVNYRGSSGCGNEFLNSLPGYVGVLDVLDCQRATLQAIAEEKCIDPKRVSLFGASHGGFLACHLSARFPELYKVAIIINPVTNLLTFTTDIPEWPWIEALGCGSFNFDRGFMPLYESAMLDMWKKSPIAHENDAIGPTLLLLGLKDRRVSPTQGLEWYRALKTQGVDIKLLTYKQRGHNLFDTSVMDTCDVVCNAAKWLRDKL